ncbi:MAG: ATP-binding protein [Verrucomicrobiales bacterium]
MCGFANAEGGTLEIGKNDCGVVVGLLGLKKLLEDLPNKIRDLLGILVEVNLREADGNDFLEISVDAYPSPISYRGHYYMRSGSTLQELKGASLDRFLLRKQGRTWDGVPVPKVSVDDLSAAAIAQFRKFASTSGRVDPAVLNETDAGLIEKLKLTEGTYLKRAAVLLFHEDPETYVNGCFVKVGYFRSESDLVYHDEVRGDLFTQVNRTLDLILTKYLKAAIRYEGLQRNERFPVPREALREALVNALVHRDYAVGAPVQIRVYEDRLKIWNPAVLPEGWTVEDLLSEHASHPFNPAIANVFFRAGEIEAWGRGISHIFEACRASGAPEPELGYQGADLWLEFPYSSDYLAAVGENVGETSGKIDPTTQKTTQKTTQRILEVLRDHPSAGRREIAEILGNISEDGVKYHLARLKEQGCIRRVGPDRGGHWEILS